MKKSLKKIDKNKYNIPENVFADECELHRTYIGDIERGERNVSLDNLARIASGLKISLKELFETVDYKK
jgi:transcriptional regulator with XRE-family HTH domain